jgi:sigma-B regulation protein RsbU (phosphoserine phosphatase)
MICGNISPGKFITFFYSVLDTRAGTLVYSNAGHNPPLLRRAGGELLRFEQGGPVLGFFKTAKYEQEEIRIEAGDRLLLFTDGVSEAFDAADEEFGEERLAALLAAPGDITATALQASILDAVTVFCDRNFHDDATLIAVTVDGSAASAAG